MREFFRGWKRMVGLVTLMVACLFTAGWVRKCSYFSATGNVRFKTWPRILWFASPVKSYQDEHP
jgi:hypothetical protein